MASNPFVRKTDPSALLLTVTPAGGPRQFNIENNWLRIEDWDNEYVNFGGYFGVHGPHLFAAAPELLAALITLRDFGCPVCSGDCGSANPPVASCPMQVAGAAITKARGK